MRKIWRSTKAFSLTLFLGVSAVVLPGHAQDLSGQAGVAAAVRGNVLLAALSADTKARRSEIVGENILSGDKIFLGDVIETAPDSGLQIMLLDETVFTIGPSAAMTIDSFVFDPSNGTGEVTTKVLKGAFRFVSGKVAKNDPKNMNVLTPLGTIGVRGTSAAGVIIPADPNTSGSTPRGTFVLLGPGIDNNAGERAGRIVVSNGGSTVEISRPGFATTVSAPNLPPSIPVRVSPQFVANLTAGLGTDGGARPQEKNASPDNSRQSGGDGREGGGNESNQNGTEKSGAPKGGQSEASSNPEPRQTDSKSPSESASNSPTATPTPGGGATAISTNTRSIVRNSGQTIGNASSFAISQIGNRINSNDIDRQVEDSASNQLSTDANLTTLEAIRSIDTGIFRYSAFGNAMSGSGVEANFDISYVIDFGNRTTNGKVQLNTGSGFAGGTANFPLLINMFETGSGVAEFTESGAIMSGNVRSGSFPGATRGGSNNIPVTYSLENADGSLAKFLNAAVKYSENGGSLASGLALAEKSVESSGSSEDPGIIIVAPSE